MDESEQWEARDMGDERMAHTGDEERQRRLERLSALARQTTLTPAETSTQATPSSALGETIRSPEVRVRSVGRWRLALAVLVLVALLASATGVYLTHRMPSAPPTPPIPAQLTLDLAQTGFSCPTGMRWSPDARRIAILAANGGYVQDCGRAPFVVLIFDTRTGKLLKTLDPLKSPSGFAGATMGTDFTWSLDSNAVILSGGMVAASQSAPFIPALLVLPVDGGAPRVLQGQPIVWSENTYISYEVWDLKAGNIAHVVTKNLPPALTYRWTSDGQIGPDLPLPTPTAAASFTGSPILSPGAATFSRWQPGILAPMQPGTPDGGLDFQARPIAETYTSASTLWSPDGRYLVFGLQLRTLLAAVPGRPAPKLDPQYCAGRGPFQPEYCAMRPVLPPDAAFATLQQDADSGGDEKLPTGDVFHSYTSYPVVWRPDGKYLATLLPATDYQSSQTQNKIGLLRCASGSLQTTLIAPHPFGNSGYSQDGVPSLAWSPTGQQLAFNDYGAARVTIWGAASLPA